MKKFKEGARAGERFNAEKQVGQSGGMKIEGKTVA